MNTTRIVSGIAMAAALLTAPDASAVDNPVVNGLGCGLEAVEDPSAPGLFVGTVQGGPVYGSTPSRPVTSTYLLCALQVNNPYHDGPDVVSTTAWGIGATSISPTPITFQLQPGDVARMCTEFWVDTNKGHVTLFLNALEGEISTDPHGDCEVLVDVSTSDVVCSSGAETVLDDVWDCSATRGNVNHSTYAHKPRLIVDGVAA